MGSRFRPASRVSDASLFRLDEAAVYDPAFGTVPVFLATGRASLLAALAPWRRTHTTVRKGGDPMSSPDDLVRELKRSRPGILLLDLQFLAPRPYQGLHEIRVRLPDTRIMLLWEDVSELDVDEIILNRVEGCQHIHAAPELYFKAIRSLAAGEFWMPRWLEYRIMQRLREQLQAMEHPALNGTGRTQIPLTLTPREREIFELVRTGLSNKEIGRKLGICEDTVKKHLKNVFAKLNIHRRIQIAMFNAPAQ